MKSDLPVFWILAAAACGGPSVKLPDDNANLLGIVDAGPLAPPQVFQLPGKRYPYHSVPVRGSARDAVAVVMIVNQAGDPLATPVSQLDQSYCGEIPLIEPADYDIAVTSQASDGRTSNDQGHLKFVYDPTAADMPSVTLCHGQRPSR